MDNDAAFALARAAADLDTHAELAGEGFLEFLYVRGASGGSGAQRGGFRGSFGQPVKVAPREVLADREIGATLLLEDVRHAGEDLGMAQSELAVADHGFDGLGEFHQTE